MRVSEQETSGEEQRESAIEAETPFFGFSIPFSLFLLFFILIARMFVLAMSG